MDDFLLQLLDTVQSVDPALRTALAGLAMMLETSILIGLIVPGDTIAIVAATAVGSIGEGVMLAAVLVLGALIGESIGFWLGRWLGPHIRHSWIGRKIGEKQWIRAERYLARRGGIAIFLSRFLPVLHSLVPLTVGMSRFAYRRFLAWTLPACILWAGLYVTVASLAAGSFRELSERIHFAGYLFVGVIALFLLVVFVGKKVIAAREERHMRAPSEDAPTSMKD